jgi:hypothetical protein
MPYPEHGEIWAQNRDNINLIVGAIIGAYLGLTISRQGLEHGSHLDLFNLITFTAFTAGAIMTCGNRWIFGNRVLAVYFGVSAFPFAFLSLRYAKRLGVDTAVLTTIFIAWGFLVFSQLASYEVSKLLPKRNDD